MPCLLSSIFRLPRRPRRAWLAAALAIAVVAAGCGRAGSGPSRAPLDEAARQYVRLVLALGERDADSLDGYHGPPDWQAAARREHATLADIRGRAKALANTLAVGPEAESADDRTRRQFLVAQLAAVVARIDILQGARPPFAEEARLLFGLDTGAVAAATAGDELRRGADDVRWRLDRLLPGRDGLAARYAAFDRRFLVPADRLPAVLSRAIEGCRAATRAHVALPAGEHVEVAYVHDLPWSAFTRYEGGFVSRIEVNASLPLTVDRALDLACHEAYPGHHTIAALLEARYGDRRPEFLVQPLFCMQSALHEAAASIGPALAFAERERTAFERDVLFPLAGLDPAGAERHVAIGRLVDRLHTVEAEIARKYLDGVLDFPRAAAALERDALMPSADPTLKFLNQFRSYAATYTVGRDLLARSIDTDWAGYLHAVTDPSQRLPAAR